MGKIIKKLLVAFTVISLVAGAAYCVTRFLLATDRMSGTSLDTREGIRHEPMMRKYIKLDLNR